MDSLRTIKNQYRGINPHAHSNWLAHGKWQGFHTTHIGDLQKLMRVQLLPMGYTSGVEESLQVTRVAGAPAYPHFDIGIFELESEYGSSTNAPLTVAPGELVMPIPQALYTEETVEKPLRALTIEQRINDDRGEIVAWIELLSPSNKGNQLDARLYRSKRRELLETGLIFVEIDYLHESPATIDDLVAYPTQTPKRDSHAYRIIVFVPRPDFREGLVHIKEFDVDDRIPTMNIPLSGEDVLTFDFNAPYQKTFEETLYGLEVVDYSRLPDHFERYSAADRARIALRMLTVLRAHQAGIDLETAPLPLLDIAPETALTELSALISVSL